MTTRSDMLEAGRQAVWRDVQYVYGAKPSKGSFHIYSRDQIQALRNAYGDMVWVSDLDKAGHECCDCSGLMTYATGEIVGSYYLRDDAVARFTISQLWDDWQKYVGMVLWLPGHVGIVSDVVGYYYAMDGSARNAVHNPMSMNSWQEVLQIRGVDYEEEVMALDQYDIAHIWEYSYKGSAPGGNMYNCMLQIHQTVTKNKTEIAALTAAVEALSKSHGVDPAKITATVDKAVRDRLAKIKVSVS